VGTGFAYSYRKSHIVRFLLLILALVVFISIVFSPSVASAVTDVTLQWNPSNGADGYRLFCREEGQNYNYGSPDWEGAETTGIIYGLNEFKTYHFVVRAYNQYGESGDSLPATYAPISNPSISLIPGSLSNSCREGTNASGQTFSLWNSGGGSLDYSISDNRSWLSVSPSTGSSTAEQDTITVNYSTSGLSAGSYSGTITVSDPSADNNPQTISVDLTVDALPPSISLSTSSLSNSCTEGTNAPSQTFNLWNSGGGSLDYSISDNRSWLSVSPSSGISTGEQDTIAVSYSTSGLSAGSYSGTIIITDPSADNSPLTVSVNLTINPSPPSIALSTTSVSNFATEGSNAPSQTFSVWNSGGTTLNYSISDNRGWLSCSPSTGASTGEQDNITVSYSTSGLSAGSYSATITISDSGADNSPQTIGVSLSIAESSLPPSKPVITSPYYGETECDLLLSIRTEPFSDPDGDTHGSSRWQTIKEQDSSVVLDITTSEHLTSLPVPHTVLDRDETYLVRVKFYDIYSEPSEWSDWVEFTTTQNIEDFDGDGVPDAHELDDTVDLNDDGTPDNDQPDIIKSIHSAVGDNEPFGVSKVSACIDAIEVLEPINPSTILDKANRPETFLFGLASYRLTVSQAGATVLVRVYYSEDISGATRYYLYDTVNGWHDYTQYTTFNEDGRSVTVELVDGGHGDSDGVANGIIVDPGGLAGAASGGLDSAAGGGCFIGTAAFDSYVEPHVKLHAAKYSDEDDWLKPIVRVLLMPLVGVSYILVRTSLVTIILLGFLLIISLISFYTVIYRRRKYQV
jgi:hypothetical protein